MPNSIDAEMLSPTERMDLIAQILAGGIIRMKRGCEYACGTASDASGTTRPCDKSESFPQNQVDLRLPQRPDGSRRGNERRERP